MALDIQKNISQLIKNQFPEFYKSEGELFLAFVQAYYEWMETQQFDVTNDDGDVVGQITNDGVIHHSRNLPDYRDIDRTLDDFILSFKNKYLSNIQFNVATNKQLFIKNALEFYRAKGSPRAVDLFFKLVYGLEARVYQPADDLFKLSDNTWNNQVYLELQPNKGNINFVGKMVFGFTSGASGFGEKLVRVKRGSLFIDALYISGLQGNFETEETVMAVDDPVESDGTQFAARMLGSLTTFEIISSSAGFEIGERVYVSDGTGKKGTAIVTAISSAVGIVDFTLIDGGWGYSNDAEVIGSKRTLRFADVTFENTDFYYHTDPFEIFQTANQDLVRFYLDESNTTSRAAALALDLGTEVYATVGDVAGANVTWEGVLVDKSVADSHLTINYTKASYTDANGDIFTDDGVDFIGNTNITALYANTSDGEVTIDVEANTSTQDVSISGNVIAVSDIFTVEYTTDYTASIENGSIVYQVNDDGHIYARARIANSFSNGTTGQTYLNLQSEANFFRSNRSFFILDDEDANNSFDIVKLSNVNIGLIEAFGSEDLQYRIYANTYVGNTSLGTFASGHANNESATFATRAVAVLSGLEDTKSQFFYQTLNKDDAAPLLINHLDPNTAIDDTANVDSADIGLSEIDWIASNNVLEYSNTVLENALNYTNTAIEIGTVSAILATNPGEGYGSDPFFVIYDPLSKHVERYDFHIRYVSEGDEDILKVFRIGEKISVLEGGVPSEDKVARIYDVDITKREIKARRLSWTVIKDDPIDTANNTLNLTVYDDFKNGDTITGESSGVSVVIENVDEMRMLPHVGRNAVVDAKALTGDGFVEDLRIDNSGFGYFGKRYINSTDVYQPGENLTLVSFNDDTRDITVRGFLGSQGVAPGNHPNRRSFLSSDKYLHDSNYYQEYSYEVLAALPFSKYKQTLIDVLHLSGSKPFGTYVGTSETVFDITPTNTIDFYDVKQFGVFVNQNTFYANTVVST